MMSSKNAMLSPAVADLGLGDALKQQLDDAELERKKKLLQQANAVGRGLSPLGPATQTLFGGANGLGL